MSPGLSDRDVVTEVHCGESRALGHRYIDESVDRGPTREYRHVAPIKETRFVSPSLLGLLLLLLAQFCPGGLRLGLTANKGLQLA